jgi:hypothetical protein
MDPTVRLQDGNSLGDPEMPRFVVQMPSGNFYKTKGPPIWQSSSPFGRGTVVWKVEEEEVANKENPTGIQHVSTEGVRVANAQKNPNTHIVDLQVKPELILKSAYHNPERIAESKFYAAINQASHPGVAVFLEGGDVRHNEEVVTTATHRHDLTPSAQDSIAHRLVLKSKGRRLSEHSTLLELLEAVLASVRGMWPPTANGQTLRFLGHETLFKYGIIHRDISIGNVFISDDSDATPGFLGDLDMAKVFDANKLAKLIGPESAQKMVKYANQGSVTVCLAFVRMTFILNLYRERHSLWPCLF